MNFEFKDTLGKVLQYTNISGAVIENNLDKLLQLTQAAKESHEICNQNLKEKKQLLQMKYLKRKKQESSPETYGES